MCSLLSDSSSLPCRFLFVEVSILDCLCALLSLSYTPKEAKNVGIEKKVGEKFGGFVKSSYFCNRF